MESTNNNDLLVVKGLRLHFKVRSGVVQAVDGVDFKLRKIKQLLLLASLAVAKAL